MSVSDDAVLEFIFNPGKWKLAYEIKGSWVIH